MIFCPDVQFCNHLFGVHCAHLICWVLLCRFVDYVGNGQDTCDVICVPCGYLVRKRVCLRSTAGFFLKWACISRMTLGAYLFWCHTRNTVPLQISLHIILHVYIYIYIYYGICTFARRQMMLCNERHGISYTASSLSCWQWWTGDKDTESGRPFYMPYNNIQYTSMSEDMRIWNMYFGFFKYTTEQTMYIM